MTLTTDDMRHLMEDEPGMGGYGYMHSREFPLFVHLRLDEAVVDAANALGLDYQDLKLWADSKNGRWLCDAVQELERLVDFANVERVVSKHLSSGIMAELRRESAYEDEDDQALLRDESATWLPRYWLRPQLPTRPRRSR